MVELEGICPLQSSVSLFFFFNATATTEIYTLSLPDALPIYDVDRVRVALKTATHDISRRICRLILTHKIPAKAQMHMQRLIVGKMIEQMLAHGARTFTNGAVDLRSTLGKSPLR